MNPEGTVAYSSRYGVKKWKVTTVRAALRGRPSSDSELLPDQEGAATEGRPYRSESCC